MTTLESSVAQIEAPGEVTVRDAVATSRNGRAGDRLEEFTFWWLCALVVFGPLAFGAVERWAMLVLHGGSAVLLLLWAAQQWYQREVNVVVSPLYVPLAAFITVIGVQLVFGATAYRAATFEETLNYSAYGIIFFVATQSLTSRKRLSRFAVVLCTFGFLLAAFSIVQDLTSNGKLYWLRAPRVSSSIFGPYVNHNHFAGMMEMLAVIPLVLVIRAYYQGPKRVLAGFAAAIIGLSIFMSASRGGVLAFMAQLAFVGATTLMIARRRSSLVPLAGVVLALAAAVCWVGLDTVMDRIQFTQWEMERKAMSDTKRIAITTDAVGMALERPLLGWGAGMFPLAYPAYRSFYNMKFVNQAHNDYIQLLVETGAAGFIAGLGFLVLLYRAGTHALLNPDPRSSDSIRLAALAGCTGIVVHSFLDFNMHIPGNAAMFFVLAALAAAPSKRRSGPARNH